MPQIPFQERRIAIPESLGGYQQVQANPSQFGQEGAAITQGGQALAKTANEALVVDQRIKRAEQVAKLSAARTSLDTDIDTFKSTFEANTNPDTYGDAVSNGYNQLKEKYQNSDPDVWKAFEPFFENKFNEARLGIKTRERKLRIDNAMSNILNSNDALEKKLAYEQDPIQQQYIKDEISLGLASAVNLGIMHEKDATRAMMGIDNRVDKYRVESMINSDPELAYKYLSDIKYYSALQPEQRAQYLRHAETTARTRDSHNARIANEQSQEFKENLLNGIYNLEKGKSSMSDYNKLLWQIDTAVNSKQIKPQDGLHLRREAERAIKGEGEGEGKGNPVAYASALEAITASAGGDINYSQAKGKILDAHNKGGITISQTNDLLKMLTSARNANDKLDEKENRLALKTAMASLNKTIDALFPKAGGKGDKALNDTLKAVALIESQKYDDPGKFAEAMDRLVIEYTKRETERPFVSKNKIAEAINKTYLGSRQQAPAASQPPARQITVVETRQTKDGSTLEKMSDGTIRKR